MSRAVGVRPSSSPSARSGSAAPPWSRSGAERALPGAWRRSSCRSARSPSADARSSASAANSRIVGERPSRSALAVSWPGSPRPCSACEYRPGMRQALPDRCLPPQGGGATVPCKQSRAISRVARTLERTCPAAAGPRTSVCRAETASSLGRAGGSSSTSSGRMRSSAATQRGQNWDAGGAAELGQSLVERARRPVDAGRQHRVERVGNVDDPRAERDLLVAAGGRDSPCRRSARGGGGLPEQRRRGSRACR